eukprot:g65626.t1
MQGNKRIWVLGTRDIPDSDLLLDLVLPLYGDFQQYGTYWVFMRFVVRKTFLTCTGIRWHHSGRYVLSSFLNSGMVKRIRNRPAEYWKGKDTPWESKWSRQECPPGQCEWLYVDYEHTCPPGWYLCYKCGFPLAKVNTLQYLFDDID